MNIKKLLLILLLDANIIISTNIYPIYKLIITPNLNDINIEEDFTDYYHYNINTRGMGIIFDYNSEINIMPYNLLLHIKLAMTWLLEDSYTFLIPSESVQNYKELVLYGDFQSLDVGYHLITEKMGITIPYNLLFNKTSVDKFQCIFLSDEDNKIVFGKYLMDLMKIEFVNDTFIIHNKDFISDVKD